MSCSKEFRNQKSEIICKTTPARSNMHLQVKSTVVKASPSSFLTSQSLNHDVWRPLLQVAGLLHQGEALLSMGRYAEAVVPLTNARDKANGHRKRDEGRACILLATVHLHSAQQQEGRLGNSR